MPKNNTLEELVAQQTELLNNRKASNQANIDRLTQRFNDAVGEEKTRLSALITLQVDYSKELTNFDVNSAAADRFAKQPTVPELPKVGLN